jgi:phosphoglycolate phosphatase-like HAD superfamily hydrolase
LTRPARRHRFVLFDLDGTLVDSFGDIAAAAARAFADVGARADADLLACCRRGLPLEELYERAFGAPATAPEHAPRYQRFFTAYREHYLPHCLDTTAPYPGVVEGLAALRARAAGGELRLAVATTKRRETALRILEGTGLLPYLDAVAGSDGIPCKPDPAVLHRAAGLAGTTLDDAVMVGDTDRDVGAAKAARCTSVAVSWGGMSAEELAAHEPDHVIDAFGQLVELVARG